MIRSILWKEAREHGATFVVLTLASIGVVLGTAGLLALDPSFGRPQVMGLMGVLILLLAVATSLLTGALLTGSDNEEKTKAWLDSLPGAAWKRWLTQIGFAFAAQAGMLAIWGIGWLLLFWQDLERNTPAGQLISGALIFTLLIVSGLAWGQWGGHRSNSVFAGLGLGMAGYISAGTGYLVFQGLLVFLAKGLDAAFGNNRYFDSLGSLLEIMPVLLAMFFGIALPIGFVASDFYRGSVRLSLTRIAVVRAFSRWAWLAYSTARGPAMGLIVVGVSLAFVVNASFLVWPIWGLIVGVVCGLSVLGSDQDGEKSFHGSLRSLQPWQFDLRVLPELCVSLAILILPLLQRFGAVVLEEIILSRHGGPPGRDIGAFGWEGIGELFPIAPWLLIWWSAGFGAALWTGLFFDKWIVSLVVSFGLGALVSSVWIPSLWGGDLSAWWPIGVVVVFWVLSRMLYRRFCAGTIAEMGPSAFATMVVSLAILTGLGLLSRFLFLPNPAAPYDATAIAKTLVNPDGRLVDLVNAHLPSNYGVRDNFDDGTIATDRTGLPVREWSEKEKKYFENEYKKNKEEYIGNWTVPEEIFSFFVANNPNLSDLSIGNLFSFNYRAVTLIRIRMFHALWQADKGKQENFAGDLEKILYVAACTQHKGNINYVQQGRHLEKSAYSILENFLLYGKPQEKTLAEIAVVLERHKVRRTKIESLTGEVGYYLSLKALDHLMNETMGLVQTQAPERSTGTSRLYWEVYNFAMKAPWELERKRRLINMWFSGDVDHPYFPKNREQFLNPVPCWYFSPYREGRLQGETREQDEVSRVNTGLDLARIGVAAKRYQLANKAFPKALAELAPKYLAEIPKDSFSNAEFHFRIVEAPKPEDAKKKAAAQAGAPPLLTAGGAPPMAGSVEPDDFGPAGAAGFSPGMGMGDFDEPTSQNVVRLSHSITLKVGTLVLWSLGPDGEDSGGIRDGFGHRNQPGYPKEPDDMIFLIGP